MQERRGSQLFPVIWYIDVQMDPRPFLASCSFSQHELPQYTSSLFAGFSRFLWGAALQVGWPQTEALLQWLGFGGSWHTLLVGA